MRWWEIAYIRGSRVGACFADTFAEACKKLGVDWQKCKVLSVQSRQS